MLSHLVLARMSAETQRGEREIDIESRDRIEIEIKMESATCVVGEFLSLQGAPQTRQLRNGGEVLHSACSKLAASRS